MKALRPYVLALLAVLATAFAGHGVAVLLDEPPPFILFLLPVALAAWFGGARSGLVATAASLVAAFWFFSWPGDFEPAAGDHLRIVVMAMLGAVISFICESLHHARRAAERERTRLKTILDHLPAGVVVADAQGQVQLVNPQVQAILRHPPRAAVLGESAHHWGALDAAGGRMKPRDFATARALRGEVTSGSEVRYLRGDGTETWIEVNAAPLVQEGAIVGAVTMFTDVGEKVGMRAALEESRMRLQLAERAARCGFFDADLVTGTSVWSPEMEALYGMEPGSMHGGEEEWSSRVHPDDLPGARRDIERAMETGELRSEWRVVLPGAEVRWIQAQGRVYYADGKPVRVAGINMDITARREAEAKMRDAEERLEIALLREKTQSLQAAGQRKDQFLAILGHELRNPIAPMRNAVEILRARGGDPSVLTRVTGVLERQLAHLTRLVEELLDVARIASGKVRLEMGDVSLGALVDGALEQVQPLIETRGHVVEVRGEGRSAMVRADPARIVQVLANLFNNAAKYTDPGGHIVVTLEREGDLARVQVRDNGIGMTRESLANVFELFAQAEGAEQRSLGGLGLGLNVARRLVEMHGGRISAQSDGPGRGSLFTLHLPLSACSATESAAA